MTSRVTGRSGNEVTSLIGVHDAEGTLAGGLRYWVGAHLTGSANCALCEITHGLIREKFQWRGLASVLTAPFEAIGGDPARLAAALGDAIRRGYPSTSAPT